MATVHIVSVSGGKDSTTTLLIAIARCGIENVIAIFCDTGNEHPQTYLYLDYLEARLGIVIHRLKADFSEQMLRKRRYIARDVRTRREYSRVPKTNKDGQPVYLRDKHGAIRLFPVLDAEGQTVELAPRQAMGWDGGRKVRWTNKAKRRALEVLRPSGNPFLDLCMWKGLFPSRKAQFCTQELKVMMAVEFQLGIQEQGHRIVSWQGVRRDESANRANAKIAERVAPGYFIFRPIAAWSARQVFDYAAAQGVEPNPLYLQGMGRVGCMPCINVNKTELRQIAARFPEEIEKIANWESIVSRCAKRGFSTMMADAHPSKDRRQVFADLNIWTRVEWAKTSRGGKQYNLLDEVENVENTQGGCSSSYGLCDQGAALELAESTDV